MNKSNSMEAIDKTKLTDQTKFLLDEVSKIENYFIKEVNQRKSCSKNLVNMLLFLIILTKL